MRTPLTLEPVRYTGSSQALRLPYSFQMNLKRPITIAEIEAEHPYLIDESRFCSSREEWVALHQEWKSFSSKIRDGDEIWEYEDVVVHLGFSSGEGGFLIRRGDDEVSRFVTFSVG